MTRSQSHSAAVLALTAGVVLGGCAPGDTAPTCDASSRLGIVAQSVEAAAYVPCVAELPTGWSVEDVSIDDEGTTISLLSDRADRDVEVALVEECDVSMATPIEPRDPGVRSYNEVDEIEPRYAGRFLEVFPGGCVVSRYDFERGPHVALVAELREAVGLVSRRQLRQELRDDLGITLDP